MSDAMALSRWHLPRCPYNHEHDGICLDAEHLAAEIIDLRAKLAEAEKSLAMAKQVSAELCDDCGWAMRFPGEMCCKCRAEQAEAALSASREGEARRVAEAKAEAFEEAAKEVSDEGSRQGCTDCASTFTLEQLFVKRAVALRKAAR